MTIAPGPPFKLPQGVEVHMTVLGTIFLLLLAVGYWLDRYDLLYSSRSIAYGAGYTDVNAKLPALTIMLVIALAMAVLLLINLRCGPGNCWRGRSGGEMADGESISSLEAARRIGCSHMTITRMVHAGRLVHRTSPPRHPSISSASVRQVRAEWRALQRAKAQAAGERAVRRAPPDDGEVWLDAKSAAAVMGITPKAIYKRAR